MPMQITYHVFPADDRWTLQPEAPGETWRFYPTREEAVAAGCRLAGEDEYARIVVHDEARRVEELIDGLEPDVTFAAHRQ